MLQSNGTLENNENVASVVNQSLNLLQNYQSNENHYTKTTENDANTLNGSSSSQSNYRTEITYKKLSFVYNDHAYICARSGNKIYVVQKRITVAPSIGKL